MNEIFLRQYLAPLQEAVAELQEAAETNRRQGNNLINKGVVVEVCEGRRVVVQIGENKTPPLQFLVPAAGDVIHYRCPSPGEIAIVLNFGNGDNFQSCIAFCGLESTSFPFPETDPDVVMTTWGKHVTGCIRLSSGEVTLSTSGDMSLQAGGEMEIRAAGGVTFVGTPSVTNAGGNISDGKGSLADIRRVYDRHDHDGVHGKTGTPNQKMEE
ncbi:TPA: phage baseplate assembly protein V [Escherichia coli]